ncbi:tyrosine-type recombinase/integrase [Sphingomonas sp. PB4P5]|uniref:tyrosine-type recombinase/integrase n=1 Tax=Parasphingomonas puruogangriensis TaxID=3096155 RepID=UPI002FC65CAA
MATVKKRAWQTATGEHREAWRVRYVDQHGDTRTRQFDLKRDADAFRVKAEGEVVAGIHTADRASVTVGDACDTWIAAAENNGRERGTLKSYREMADLHIKPLLGKEKLSRLTAPKVVTFADAMTGTRSIAMASKAVRALSMILGEAQRRGFVSQNVARGVTVSRSRRDKKRIVIPPRAHLLALIEAADAMDNVDPRAGVIVRVAMFAGLRSSELRGFIWPDVDLSAPNLSVTQRADRWNDIGAPKSDAGHRTIPIGPTLALELKRWKLRCPASPTKLLFPNGRGKPMSQHSITSLFTAVQVAAGLALDSGQVDAKGETIWKPRYGLHTLRHAAASAWIKQGIDLKRLQVWIGHATIQLTIDTYGHLITDAQADAALAGGAETALLA